jgi:hypothetical protein
MVIVAISTDGPLYAAAERWLLRVKAIARAAAEARAKQPDADCWDLQLQATRAHDRPRRPKQMEGDPMPGVMTCAHGVHDEADCMHCRTFVCAWCRIRFEWPRGADDERPLLCDDCWLEGERDGSFEGE